MVREGREDSNQKEPNRKVRRLAGDLAGYIGEFASEAAGLGVHAAAKGSKKAGVAAGRGAVAGGKQMGRGAVAGGKQVGKGAKQVSAVLTGADILVFDEFTQAVTRIVMGLHEDNEQLKQDNAELREGVAKLEARVAEVMGEGK